MDTVLWVALGILGMVVFGLGLRRLVDWIGSPCQFCEASVQSFRRVGPEVQASILQYFSAYERREPDTGGLFICMNCHTVHDDFSGEKASRDFDRFGCVTFCKVCHAIMRGCEPDRGTVNCSSCGTPYEWRTHADSGFRFFMPPRDVTISARPPHFLIDSR
jgi:hypothetical protein